MGTGSDPNGVTESTEIPAAIGDFAPLLSGDGPPHPLQRAIFPIVQGRVGHYWVVGTCFAIGSHLLLTAAHCVDGLAEHWPETLGAVYVGGVHDNGDLMGGLLNITRVSMNPECDIALLQVALPTDEHGNALRHFALPLTLASPSVGEVCTALGYTVGTEVEIDEDDVIVTLVSPQIHASTGEVEAVYMNGRDRVFRNPAFQVGARYDHQMSGCPILGSATGRVVGVVSTGALVEEGAVPYGTGSLLWPAMGLGALVDMENGPTEIPLLTVAHTLLNLDDTLSMVSVDSNDSDSWTVRLDTRQGGAT